MIATPATTRSQAFRNRLLQLDPGVSVYAKACPLFVPLVENGYIEDDNPVTSLVAEEYIAPLREAGIDTLIYGLHALSGDCGLHCAETSGRYAHRFGQGGRNSHGGRFGQRGRKKRIYSG